MEGLANPGQTRNHTPTLMSESIIIAEGLLVVGRMESGATPLTQKNAGRNALFLNVVH